MRKIPFPLQNGNTAVHKWPEIRSENDRQRNVKFYICEAIWRRQNGEEPEPSAAGLSHLGQKRQALRKATGRRVHGRAHGSPWALALNHHRLAFPSGRPAPPVHHHHGPRRPVSPRLSSAARRQLSLDGVEQPERRMRAARLRCLRAYD